MNVTRPLGTTFSTHPRLLLRRIGAAGLDLGRRATALSLVSLMIPLGLGNLAFGQDAPPPPPPDQSGYDQAQPPDQDYDQGPPPQQWNALSPEQLDQLVAPVALYPDSLVAQVLAAATYPSQVADAERFVESYRSYPPDQLAQMANQQPWDPSIKALTAFPSVLDNMNRNLDWTTQLGNAYYNQPQDVMSAVQADRQQAWASGHLRPTPQLAVTYAPDDIVIAPANPAVVYVPYYNPWTVWGWHPYYRWYAPPPPRGLVIGAGLAFGVGVAVGAWSHWGWGWGHWGCGWGRHPVILHEHVTYISRSVTVVNHGYYGHFDRHPEAREFNHRYAVEARSANYNRGHENFGRPAGNFGARENRPVQNLGHEQNRPAQNYGRPENRPAQNYGRPENRPAQNYGRPENRPAQNIGRPENRPAQNYGRPAPNAGRPENRPAPNFGRPETFHPAPQTRPSGGGARPESHGGGARPESHGGGSRPEPHGGGGHENHGGGGNHEHHGH
jgi:hypothetical protein